MRSGNTTTIAIPYYHHGSAESTDDFFAPIYLALRMPVAARIDTSAYDFFVMISAQASRRQRNFMKRAFHDPPFPSLRFHFAAAATYCRLSFTPSRGDLIFRSCRQRYLNVIGFIRRDMPPYAEAYPLPIIR